MLVNTSPNGTVLPARSLRSEHTRRQALKGTNTTSKDDLTKQRGGTEDGKQLRVQAAESPNSSVGSSPSPETATGENLPSAQGARLGGMKAGAAPSSEAAQRTSDLAAGQRGRPGPARRRAKPLPGPPRQATKAGEATAPSHGGPAARGGGG